MLTSEQIRAARMLLRWEQRDLAERSGVSLPTIKRLETKAGTIQAYGSTLGALRSAIESAGVAFLANGETVCGGSGVRLKGSNPNAD